MVDQRDREVSLMGELKVMVPEILFLVALKEHNKKLWYRSFPFHFGLYLVVGLHRADDRSPGCSARCCRP